MTIFELNGFLEVSSFWHDCSKRNSSFLLGNVPNDPNDPNQDLYVLCIVSILLLI